MDVLPSSFGHISSTLNEVVVINNKLSSCCLNVAHNKALCVCKLLELQNFRLQYNFFTGKSTLQCKLFLTRPVNYDLSETLATTSFMD